MSMDNNLLSRRTFFTNSNNVSHKSGVYDDAFGAAHPRLPLPNLAPRLEDYSEIFVDASRSFSIPVLDLPFLTGGDDSNHFDYAEIFGGVDFDSSSSSDDDHDDEEPWSPAQSGSLSDEFDPLARSDNSLRLSDAADAHHSLETTKQFNASYNNNSSQSNIGTVLVGATVHVTNFSALSNPGYTLSDYNVSPVSCDGEDEICSVSAIDVPSLAASKEHGKRVALEKQHTKCSGNPVQRNDFINLSEDHENFTCKPFVTVSDISLRTKPSRLPPPSRPPPALSAKKGDSGTSELKASKSYALERLADDSSSLSSEVEVVSATLSPDGTGNGNGNKDVGNYDATVAWGEGNEYFEVIENNISKQAFDVIQDCDILSRHMNTDAYKHRRDTGSSSDTGKKVKVLKEGQGLEKQRRQPEVTNEQKEIPNTRLSDQTSFQEKVIRSILTSQCSFNKMGTEDFQQFREREKLPTDNCETVEVLPQGEGNLIEVDARSELKESNKGVDIGKKTVDAQMTRQNSGKHNQNIPREEFQLKNVEVAENRDQPLPCEVEKDYEKLFEVGIQVKNELMHKDSLQQIRNEKDQKLSHDREVTEERNIDAPIVEDNGLRYRKFDTDPSHTSGSFTTKGHINLSRPDGVQKEPKEDATEAEPVESNEHEKEVEVTATTVSRKQYNEENGQLKVDLNSTNHEGEPIDFSKQKNEGIAVNITSRGPPIQDTPQFISKTVDVKDSFIPCQVIKESSLVNGMKEKHSDGILHSIKNATSQKIEIKNYNNFKDNLTAKDQKVGERIRREIELENEQIRKIEEKEREREREKDRMAVDKAALEACERSYTDARERAAVNRVTAELRQRAMAEARERLENSSIDTKLRTDRAAIERATSEARQRAAEKSMSQSAASEIHFCVERSASLKYSVMRQSSLSSDTHLQSTGSSSNLRYSYSFGHAGADSESPQRCKARLERYQRTAERAANALAEKNMRDLLVQREREEMNRVAETLESEIKRWSGGKEANLRALLSTLQYILGPDSGWQPVPLTEVITSAAVKRAYRKATLCVHPDKLQQRGATIQQKYICEKVFDLLKEAWNKFNSEEM